MPSKLEQTCFPTSIGWRACHHFATAEAGHSAPVGADPLKKDTDAC